MWIHGNLETGQTDIYSSLMQEKGDVVFAPLVADLVDNLEGLEPNLPIQNVRYFLIVFLFLMVDILLLSGAAINWGVFIPNLLGIQVNGGFDQGLG